MRVTATDLTRAVEHLDAAVRVVDRIDADTTEVRRRSNRESTSTDWWTGPQGDDVRVHLGTLHHSSAAASPAWTSVGSTLTGLRQSASTLHAELVDLERRRHQVESRPPLFSPVLDDLVDWPGGAPGADSEESRRATLRAIDGSIDVVGMRWTDACRLATGRLDGALDAVAGSLPELGPVRLGSLAVPTGLALDAIEATLLGELPPAGGASAVAGWFASLSMADRAAWTEDAPQVIGNTDGIPYAFRIPANRTVMQDLVDRLDPGDPLFDTMQQFVLPGTTIIDPNRQIVFFDPAGDGRVAELFGDLSAADRVAVLVPGMGSTMGNFTSGVGGDARALFAATPGSAVIAWTGYDAPAGLGAGSPTEVMSSAQARAGGTGLVSFMAGLDLEHGAPTTLVGHSYGSATVGQGLLQGVQVDRVVFIGSPGVGVDRASDFPDGAATEFFAGEIDGDPVATLEHFGEAPTDPDFGAVEFDAGSSDDLDLFGRHSQYYDDGPGLDNLSTIVSGGEPTGTSQRPSEHLIEFSEDVDDGIDRGIDFVQDHVRVPFDDSVDRAVDVAQGGYERITNVRDTLFESVDNVGSSAAGKAKDFFDDHVDITFWN